MTTNLERIRQMNSEELAKYMSSCVSCIYYNEDCSGKSCKCGRRKWLEQEVEE